MPDAQLLRAAEIFTTRLQTLSELLKMAEGQWHERGKDPEALLAARLADDMFPLPSQVYFVCKQANDLAAWCSGTPAPVADPKTFTFNDMTRHIADAALRLKNAAAQSESGVLKREKRTDLIDGLYLQQTGEAYIEDLITPNFYFHLVTAYGILRKEGVQIGKKDYMAHLGPFIKRTPAG